jgi:predicted metal-dependent HD superfamily phosphohydrolase
MRSGVDIPEDILADLKTRYAEVHRAYHTFAHIEEMLSLAESVKPDISNWDAFCAAILFHDAIYDPRASDNERRSADLLHEKLNGILPAPSLDHAEALVMATAGHVLPDESDALRKDAALFLDIDLSILGAAPEKFAIYDAAIRHEFAHVPALLYKSGRRGALKKFLDRDPLYLTDIFARRFEAQARINLSEATKS